MSVLALVQLDWVYPDCAKWKDDPQFGHIDHILLDFKIDNDLLMWFPRIWQTNGVGSNVFILSTKSHFEQIELYSDGTAVTYSAINFVATCDNVADGLINFPFDTQTCTLKFVSWFNNRLVNVTNEGISSF